jgi:dihydrolipoamide dehydrogenase
LTSPFSAVARAATPPPSAPLGARVACIDRAPELGGTCLRIGCIPTKAWVQTALALKQAEETFGKLGVKLVGSHLDFPAANEWKAAVVKRMTGGVAFLFKANGVTWVKGAGTFTDPHTLAVTGGEDVTFTSAIIATGSFPLRPPIEGLESGRCVDSEGLLSQTEVPRRLVILGGGVIGCEFASIFARFGKPGDDHRDAPGAHPAGGRRRLEGAGEPVPQARYHAAPGQPVHQGRGLRIGAECAPQ